MSFRWLTLCSLALLLIDQTALPARELIVATSGDDQAAGTRAAPLRTIGKAVALARAGDLILVRGGIYREGVRLAHSGTKGAPITLKNYPGEHPVIQPGVPNTAPPAHAVLLQAREGHATPIGWITIEGLELCYGHDGVKYYNAHDIVIRNCRIHDNWNQGMLGNGNRVLIDRNVIADNGRSPKGLRRHKHGIYSTGTAFTITNNLIYSNSAYGIQVAAYPYKQDSMAGPEYAWAKNWLIANNTFALNGGSGIVLWQDGVQSCVVQNNIFYKNARPNAIMFYTQKGRRHLVRNNLFFPKGEQLLSQEEAAYDARDNREVDPQFVDAASFNFRLKPGSPAAGAGTAEHAPPVDIEGTPRAQGSRADIGAYAAATK
jgi:hypothetical protein